MGKEERGASTITAARAQARTAAHAASHERGKPLAQLLAVEQQMLFSWSVIPLRHTRSHTGPLGELLRPQQRSAEKRASVAQQRAMHQTTSERRARASVVAGAHIKEAWHCAVLASSC
eukprot:COSAG02_NODE_5696_length_4115_cov_5.925548_4_plen_118_part_00